MITNRSKEETASSFSKIFPLKSRLSLRLIFVFFILFFILILSHSFIIRAGFKKYLMYHQNIKAMETNSLIAYQTKRYLEFPEKALQSLKTFLENASVSDRDKEALLIRLTIDDESFQYLSLIDLKGDEIVCSEPEKKLVNTLDSLHVKKAINGETSISPVLISNEFYPYMIKTIPIITLGKVSCVLYSEINLKGIWENIDSLSLKCEGDFFIISEKGILCSYKNKKFVMKNDDKKTQTITNAALNAINQTVELSLSPKENYLITTKKIDDMNYYLVLQLNTNHILSKIRKINGLIIFSSGIILLLALVLIGGIGKRISLPIIQLTENIEDIGERYLNRDINMENRNDEIGKLYQAFIEMNNKVLESKARERLAVLGESSIGISHEIRNPITAIKNYVNLIIEFPEDKEIYQKFTYAVPKEMERIEHLLSDLSSLSLGKKIIKIHCSIIDILDDVLLLFENNIASQRISCIKKYQLKNPYFDADPEKLKSVFINLIKNSLFAVPSEGGLITIEINETWECQNFRHLHILFKDNGSGISSSTLPNVFNPFFTTKQKGLGIGLAVSKGIIEQHGGKISVFSEGNGKGAEFKIILPG